MQLKDPISVHIAGTNLEAQMIANHLTALGIPAYAIEDTSGVSTFSFGVISQFHKPMVYAERAQADEARKLIKEYEDAAIDVRADETSNDEGTDYCHSCGERVARGTPTCPECERPIDWSDDEEDKEDDSAPNMMSTMKEWKKPLLIAVFVGPFLLTVVLPVLFEFVKSLFSSANFR